MARKTTEPSTTRRSKKTASTTQTAPTQVSPELENVTPNEAQKEVVKEVPQIVAIAKNGRQSPAVSGNATGFNVSGSNIEEQIRRRAYELYLERRALAGSESSGDPNQDWLIAEREVRSHLGSRESRA